MTHSTRTAERRSRIMLKRMSLTMASLPSIAPETLHAVLQREADRPMRGGAQDLQHGGLFDDAQRQLDLL